MTLASDSSPTTAVALVLSFESRKRKALKIAIATAPQVKERANVLSLARTSSSTLAGAKNRDPRCSHEALCKYTPPRM
jgi:hypothetical protein